MHYIVIESVIPTAHSLHPHITLWRKEQGKYPEEFKGKDGWLSDFDLGDYEADIRCARSYKEFDTLHKASEHLPEEILQHLDFQIRGV